MLSPRLHKVGESYGWMKRHWRQFFSSFFNFFLLITICPLLHAHPYDSPDQAACCDIFALSSLSLMPHMWLLRDVRAGENFGLLVTEYIFSNLFSAY